MMKKLFAIIMSMLMIACFMPTMAFAGEGEEPAIKGTEENPYTLEDLSSMTREAYIQAQSALGGTMYVTVGEYSYDKDGTLGNGERNDTLGQTPDHSKLNAYAENGYLNADGEDGKKNDGANGRNIVFVGGTITSGATGYTDIDHIGTSLLLAVPAYTNVTFKGTTFNNVISFNYQLYTSPWSQLGELKLENCTFNGIIVGATAAQTVTFDGCTFNDYTNTASANNSNPTWIRPAYGNWTPKDNIGQGEDFKSLTKINFTNNKVTSTRPVKFENVAQWKNAEVTITGNTFNISRQENDTECKNVGIYLGPSGYAYDENDGTKLDLIWDNNEIEGDTAAAICLPKGKSKLPNGSKISNPSGEEIVIPVREWKTENDTVIGNAVSIGNVGYETLEEALSAAKDGDTVKLNADITLTSANTTANSAAVLINKNITLDGNNKTITADTENWPEKTHIIGIHNGETVTIQNLTIVGNENTKHGINVWTAEGQNKTNVTLSNVTIQNCGTAALVVNNSIVTATNLNTSGNKWGAVNVDKGAPEFTLVSGNLQEEFKVWSELTGDALKGIKLPTNWKVVATKDGKTFYAYVAPSGGGGGTSSAATTLDKAKAEANTALSNAAAASKYDDAEQAEVKSILEKAATDIKAAKTEDEVKAIKDAAQAEIDKVLTSEENAQIKALSGVSSDIFKAKSKYSKLNGKRAIKVTWNVPEGMKLDGYEVFRSTERYSGFGKTPYFTTSKTSYTNNKELKSGKTYYYKVRGFVEINGERYYTGFSTKAFRTIK